MIFNRNTFITFSPRFVFLIRSSFSLPIVNIVRSIQRDPWWSHPSSWNPSAAAVICRMLRSSWDHHEIVTTDRTKFSNLRFLPEEHLQLYGGDLRCWQPEQGSLCLRHCQGLVAELVLCAVELWQHRVRPTGSPLSGLCLPGHRGTTTNTTITTNTTNTVTELSSITEPDDRKHLLHCWSWMCLRELLHGRDSFSMSACVALYIWSYNLICLIVDFLQSFFSVGVSLVFLIYRSFWFLLLPSFSFLLLAHSKFHGGSFDDAWWYPGSGCSRESGVANFDILLYNVSMFKPNVFRFLGCDDINFTNCVRFITFQVPNVPSLAA